MTAAGLLVCLTVVTHANGGTQANNSCKYEHPPATEILEVYRTPDVPSLPPKPVKQVIAKKEIARPVQIKPEKIRIVTAKPVRVRAMRPKRHIASAAVHLPNFHRPLRKSRVYRVAVVQKSKATQKSFFDQVSADVSNIPKLFGLAN